MALSSFKCSVHDDEVEATTDDGSKGTPDQVLEELADDGADHPLEDLNTVENSNGNDVSRLVVPVRLVVLLSDQSARQDELRPRGESQVREVGDVAPNEADQIRETLGEGELSSVPGHLLDRDVSSCSEDIIEPFGPVFLPFK